MTTLLQDQVILVTGSTRGIGRAIAAELLDQGAIVGLHGRDEAVVHEVAGQLCDDPARTIPLAADLQDPAAGAALVKSVLEQRGQIDGLVNNAANNPKVETNESQSFSRLENFPAELWEQDMPAPSSCATKASPFTPKN